MGSLGAPDPRAGESSEVSFLPTRLGILWTQAAGAPAGTVDVTLEQPLHG